MFLHICYQTYLFLYFIMNALDTINVIEWACDIVLTMKLESASEEKRRKTQEGTRGPAHSKIRSQTVVCIKLFTCFVLICVLALFISRDS